MEAILSKKTIYAKNLKYAQYRIPGMVVTKKGTLLLYNEARTTSGDWAKMDIILKRSTDNGKTFSDPVVLVESSDTHKTVNNPVMVVGNDNAIHFFYCEDYSINGGRVMHAVSRDDGLTFSEPVDITQHTFLDKRNVFALGPGHGACNKDGVLIVPFWSVLKSAGKEVDSHFPSVVGVLYSTDNGTTFKVSNLLDDTFATPSPNETSCVSLADGSFYLNIRLNCNYRAGAYFDVKNGLTDFTPYPNLYDTICYGSVDKITFNNREVILFTNCDNRPDEYKNAPVPLGTYVWTERKFVTLKASFDNGKTFSTVQVIDPDKGGYSEIAVDDDKKLVYIYYEEDFGSACHLVTIDGNLIIKDA